MTNSPDHDELLDPSSILQQTAGLADHLARMGVQWLPQPDPEAVEQWKSQFAIAQEATEATDSSPSASSPPASSPPANASAAASPASTSSTPTANPPASRGPSGGLSGVPRSPSPAATFTLDADAPAAAYAGPSLPVAERTAELDSWSQQVAQCTRCEVLAKCRTKTVFGEGSVSPRVVFFGEGPGRDEDLSGRPFVGKAGELLTKMIQACQFQREDVYIMNTVKCRPPNNRNPEPTEIENCREYFEAQLNLLRPEYIVCLGLVSAQALLKTKLSVGRMRGTFHQFRGSKVLVTYHPAYLLRTPKAKKAAWEDLQIMLRDAGLI